MSSHLLLAKITNLWNCITHLRSKTMTLSVMVSSSHLLQDKCLKLSNKYRCVYVPVSFLHLDCHTNKPHSIEDAVSQFEKPPGPPSIESCISILQKCRKEKDLAYAKRVHRHICNHRLDSDIKLGSYIVAMFAECGNMVCARQVFDKLRIRNDYSWTSLLQGYNDFGEPIRALELLPKFKEDLVRPSRYTYQALLKACAVLKSIQGGHEVHSEIVIDGFEKDAFVGSNIVDMYVKCGLLSEACDVFEELVDRDVVLWTALVTGYAQHGFYDEVLNCLMKMRSEGISPNPVTFICGLKSCGNIDQGHQIHIEIVKNGHDEDDVVGNALLDMYAKTGSLVEARKVFADLKFRSTVSWTVLISSHVEHGDTEKPLLFFEQMLEEDNIVPDALLFACALKASGNVGVVDKGFEMHAWIMKAAFESDIFVANSLVDMYAKCGLLSEAQETFKNISEENEVLWSSLISACASQGEIILVFDMFEKMIKKGIQPDRIVFLSILTACTHAGIVDIGIFYFSIMSEIYGISQSIEHLNSIVDLLGRAGRLFEASMLLEIMPIQPNLISWVTLLGACRNQGKTELGRDVLEYALKLHKRHSGSLLLALHMIHGSGG